MSIHIPTWLRIQLDEAAKHTDGTRYMDVGWHLGTHHPDQFDLDAAVAAEITEAEIDQAPSEALRRLFRNEEHPDAEFVDLIPQNRRRDFLRGLIAGLCGEELPT